MQHRPVIVQANRYNCTIQKQKTAYGMIQGELAGKKLSFTCAIVAVDQACDVGFGLTGHQVRWTELFQHPVVFVLINLPLIIDPRECEEARP